MTFKKSFNPSIKLRVDPERSRRGQSESKFKGERGNSFLNKMKRPKKLQKSLILAIVSLGVLFCLVSNVLAETSPRTILAKRPIKEINPSAGSGLTLSKVEGVKSEAKIPKKIEVIPLKPVNATYGITKSYNKLTRLNPKSISGFNTKLLKSSPLRINHLTRANTLDYAKRMSNLKSIPLENLENATGKIRSSSITGFKVNSLTGHNHLKTLDQKNLYAQTKIKPLALKPKITDIGRPQLQPIAQLKPITPPRLPRQNLRVPTIVKAPEIKVPVTQSMKSNISFSKINNKLGINNVQTNPPKARLAKGGPIKRIDPLITLRVNPESIRLRSGLSPEYNRRAEQGRRIEPKPSVNLASPPKGQVITSGGLNANQPKLKTQNLSQPIKQTENKILAASSLKNSLAKPVSLKGSLPTFKSNTLTHNRPLVSYTDASKLTALKNYTWVIPVSKSEPKEPPYRHSQAAPVIPVSSQNLPQPKPTNNPSSDNHQLPQIIYLGIIGTLICGKRKQNPFDSFERLSLDIKDRLLEQNGVGTTQNNRASPNTMAKRTSAFVHQRFTRLQNATE